MGWVGLAGILFCFFGFFCLLVFNLEIFGFKK